MNKRFKAAYLTFLTVGMLANMSVIMAAEENWFTRYGYHFKVVSMCLILGGLYRGDNMGFGAFLAGYFGLHYASSVNENMGHINRVKKYINNSQEVVIPSEQLTDPILTPKAFVKNQDELKFVLLELDRCLKALKQPSCLQSIKDIVQDNEQAYKHVVYKLQEMLDRFVLHDFTFFVSKLNDAQKTTLKLFKKNNNTSSNVEIVKKVFKALDKEQEDFDRYFGLFWVMPNVKEAAMLYLKLRKLSVALDFC